MGTFPTSPRAAFLEWCGGHTDLWVARAAQIGLTPAQAAAFAAAADALQEAVRAQSEAQQAALAKTAAAEVALRTLRQQAGEAVRTIRAFAEAQTGAGPGQPTPQEIYNAAQIAAPAPLSPAPPPAEPRRLTIALDATTGFVTLRWKASNPPGASGTSYIVRRRLPGDAGFVFLGVSGVKRFVDDTLPAGTPSVQYCVQGQRAAARGPLSMILQVNFGRAADGARTATMQGTQQISAAAVTDREGRREMVTV